MVERPRFRQNYGGVGKMLRSPQMRAAMVTRAEKLKARMEAMSPRLTGNYGSSFQVTSGLQRGPGGGKRAWAKVVNTSPHAAYVEWGGRNTPRYRVMGRASGSQR